jgi:hypothetical protein
VNPNSTLARVVRAAGWTLTGVAALCLIAGTAALGVAGYLMMQGTILAGAGPASAVGAAYVALSLGALSFGMCALILAPLLAAAGALLAGFATKLEAAPSPSWPQIPGWPPQTPSFPPFQFPGLPPLPTPPPFPWMVPCCSCCCGGKGGEGSGFPLPPPWSGGMDPNTFMRLWLETAKAFLDANAKRVQSDLKRVEDAVRNGGDHVDDELKKAQDALREEAERLRKLGGKVEDVATAALAHSVLSHRP